MSALHVVEGRVENACDQTPQASQPVMLTHTARMYGHAPHAACRALLPPPSAVALLPVATAAVFPPASAAALLTTSAARLRHRESSFVSTLCGASVPCGSSTYLRDEDTRGTGC